MGMGTHTSHHIDISGSVRNRGSVGTARKARAEEM